MNNINPGQIVYLECLDQRLYAEVIQSVSSARLWCRPLMLVGNLPHGSRQQQRDIATAATDPETCSLDLYDLKTAPDLLWPIHNFNMAFDTDFFALLFHLRISEDSGFETLAKQHFQNFLHTCWHHSSSKEDTPDAPTKLVSIR